MAIVRKLWYRLFTEQVRFFLQFALLRYLATPERKPWSRQGNELRACRRRYGMLAIHYFTLDLYRADAQRQPESVVPPQLLDRYRDAINPPQHQRLVKDKRRFGEALSGAGLPVVKNLFQITGREIQGMNGEQRRFEFDDFVAALAEQEVPEIFVKPYRGSRGLGCHVFTVAGEGLRSAGQPLTEDEFFKRLNASEQRSNRRTLVQMRLTQHPRLNDLNPSCINSARLVTFMPDGQQPTIFGTMLRCGVGGACADNVSSGGLAIPVRSADGVLTANAQGNPATVPVHITTHPDTGVRFQGLQVPFWGRCRTLCLQAARLFPELPLVGWDLAITPEGPVFMEGNHRPAAEYFQLAGNLWGTPVGEAALDARRRGLI